MGWEQDQALAPGAPALPITSRSPELSEERAPPHKKAAEASQQGESRQVEESRFP